MLELVVVAVAAAIVDAVVDAIVSPVCVPVFAVWVEEDGVHVRVARQW